VASVSVEDWKILYEAAVEIKELRPWEFMEEVDIFGVQSPSSGEIGFVSVMGSLGEHVGLSVYLGSEGLLGFWDMVYADPSTPPEIVLEIPQLQVSFDDRDDLDRKDLDLIKKLGLKFKGKNSWPTFRSIVPGFLPWFLEKDEVLFLTGVLTQSINVISRFKKDNSTLDFEDDFYLVRVPHGKKSVRWMDEILEISFPEPRLISYLVDEDLVEKAQGLKKLDMKVELDLFMIPAAIGAKRDQRPSNAYALMAVEAAESIVIGVDILSVERTLFDMWERIPMSALNLLMTDDTIPVHLTVKSLRMLDLLEPIAKRVGFSLEIVDYLPSLEMAKESLTQSLRR